MNNLITVKDLAEKYGVSKSRMHALIKKYKVKIACTIGDTFMIKRSEARKIPKERPVGRPPNDE